MNNKIYIVSLHYNNPLFIKLQYKSIKKYVEDENIEFIVFDDSKDINITNSNQSICNEFNIKYIRINQNIHFDRNSILPKKLTEIRKKMISMDSNFDIYNNRHLNNTAGARHVDGIHFIFDYFFNNINDCEHIFNIDSDMFFINNINLKLYFSNYNLWYVSQSREIENKQFEYAWPNIFSINIKNFNNYYEISWDGCRYYCNDKSVSADTGGETYEFLLTFDNKQKIEYRQINSLNDLDNLTEYINNENINILLNEISINNNLFNEFYINYNNKLCIFHIRGFTWNAELYNEEYKKKLNNSLEKLLNNI